MRIKIRLKTELTTWVGKEEEGELEEEEEEGDAEYSNRDDGEEKRESLHLQAEKGSIVDGYYAGFNYLVI